MTCLSGLFFFSLHLNAKCKWQADLHTKVEQGKPFLKKGVDECPPRDREVIFTNGGSRNNHSCSHTTMKLFQSQSNKLHSNFKSALNKNPFKIKLLTSLFKDGRFPAFIV